MGNSRGNDYSLKHKSLSVNSTQFWDFSWHEIGYYDLPAMIDEVLRKSKASRGFYVGHSRKLNIASIRKNNLLSIYRRRDFHSGSVVNSTRI